MRSLGLYVDDAVKSLNAQKSIDFYRLKEAWLKAVGPILAGQAEPTKMRGTLLYVTVSSPMWSQEIHLQQRLILGRLKSLLRFAPTKITCFVGQPHAATPTKSERQQLAEDDKVPWADQIIPEHRQSAIETTLAALPDDTLRDKIRPLLELAVRRELHFLNLGLLPCQVCGDMRPPEQDSCDRCLKEQQVEAEHRIMRMMARKPWMKVRDIQDLAPWAGRAQIIRLKKQLRSDLLQQAWQLAEGLDGEELAAKLKPAFRKLLLDITMLTCHLPADSLQPRHFTYSLGRRLAHAYLGIVSKSEKG